MTETPGEITLVSRILTITAIRTAVSQFSDLPIILVIAQIAIIGPLVTTCSPMVIKVCTWVMSKMWNFICT